MQEGRHALRVLVVEDEPLVAMLAEDMLADLGHRVIATAHRLGDGLAAFESQAFDLALLDVSLGTELSFPLADLAERRGVPVLFVTGFSSEHMEQLADRFVLQKPYTSQDLHRAIARVLEREHAGG